MTELQKHLRKLKACSAGLEFAGNRPALEVWNTCTRPDWLGWWLANTNTEPENRKLAKLYCRIWTEDLSLRLPESQRQGFNESLAAIGNWCDNPTEQNRKKAHALARALALDLDLDLARARALAHALAHALDLALDLARALALDLDLDLDLNQKWCDSIRAEFNCPFVESVTLPEVEKANA
jgi:hypothetical protein